LRQAPARQPQQQATWLKEEFSKNSGQHDEITTTTMTTCSSGQKIVELARIMSIIVLMLAE
jgi:hypothetical protein